MYVLSAVMDLAHRRIYQPETIDGQGYGTITHMSTFQGSLRLMKRNWFVCATVYGAAIYIQIAGELKLQTNQSLLLFTGASLGLKLLLQEAAKLVTVKGKRMQIKTIYIAVAIPTVLIDTQIRVALLRQSSVQNSITDSVVFSMVEIATRFVKVWLVRLEVWLEEQKILARVARRPSIMQVLRAHTTRRGSLTGLKIQSGARYAEFVQWRRRVVRFHADMYAEYLAIGCSMAIFFFFHDHPKYAWKIEASSMPQAASPQLLDWKEQSVCLAAQLGIEMVVDFLSCYWELVVVDPTIT